MKAIPSVFTLVIGLHVYVAAQAPDDAASLKQLYDNHQIFELREALDGKSGPPLYLGAVAAGFNHVADGEKYLKQAIREALTIEAANEAREWLINLYMRFGRSSDAARLINEALKAAPSRFDLRNARGFLRSFSRYPNQTVETRRPQTFPCTVNARGLVFPLSVNGKR